MDRGPDDPRHRPEEGGPARPGRPGERGGGPDATGHLPAGPGDDGTAGPPDGDGTAELPGPGADDTRRLGDADDTRSFGGADDTRPFAGPAGPGAAGTAERWSGRAGVPRPVPADQATEAWPGEQPGGRGILMPLLIGLLILVLLALLGYAAWLVLRPRGATPAPVPSLTSSAAPSPTASPTSRPPKPTASPPAPTTTRPPPATVTVPPVTGLRLDAATAALEQAGLRWNVQRVDSPGPPDVVLRTDPQAGTEVSPGAVVTLFVPATPATSAPAASTPPAGG